jgi:hypothetical protein
VYAGEGSVAVGNDLSGQVNTGAQMVAGGVGIGMAGAVVINQAAQGVSGVHQPLAVDDQFDSSRYSLASSQGLKTGLRIADSHAGVEARALDGAVAKGNSLIVVLQKEDTLPAGLDIWLTVTNQGTHAVRWFAPVLTAYAEPKYEQIRPVDGHFLYDIYPGEQYTFRYTFPFGENIRGAKYMTCTSWDTELTFWWARGA